MVINKEGILKVIDRRLSISIASPRRDSFSSESTVYDTNEEEEEEEEEEEVKASGLTKTDPNNQRSCHLNQRSRDFVNGLIERLELLILETKAGHDGLSDEMLDISKQLLSMNIISQEQLDNFVFNYGK